MFSSPSSSTSTSSSSSSISSPSSSNKRKNLSQIEQYFACIRDEKDRRVSGKCLLCRAVVFGLQSANYWHHLTRKHCIEKDEKIKQQKISASFPAVPEDAVKAFKSMTAELFAVQGFPHSLLGNSLFKQWLSKYEAVKVEQKKKLPSPKEHRLVTLETGTEVFERTLTVLSSRVNARVPNCVTVAIDG